MNKLTYKFSTNLSDVIKRAQKIAIDLKHKEVKIEHILYTLLSQKGSIGAEVLTGVTLQEKKIQKYIESHSKPMVKTGKTVLSDNAKDSLLKATSAAFEYQHKHIGTEHLLLGVIETNDQSVLDLLGTDSTSIPNVKKHLSNIMQNTSRFPDLSEVFGATNPKEKARGKKRNNLQKNSSLENFGIELTDENVQSTIDPVIGREDEIKRIIQILCRRTKNNPILLGEAGVGKTAIVEGLAKKIVEGDVPDILLNKKIYTLDLGLIIGGAMFRGEFEARFKQLLEEIKEDPNIIVFIDEIHTLMGAGSAGGSLDAANMLKPALARGDVRCVGATTFSEYRKSIEDDPALERRFQAVRVEEPGTEKTIKILNGIKRKYEIFHKVEITDEAIKAAVKFGEKYMSDKYFPDKAIDLIDEAAARIKTQHRPSEITILINTLNREIEDIRIKKQDAVLDEQYTDALQFKDIEKKLEQELLEIQEDSKSESDILIGKIDESDIAEIISQSTKIPVSDISGNEKSKLLALENILNRRVIGQKGAVKTIVESIKRSRTGVRNQNQPIGSFIFLGPSGVGKTELAKQISEKMFGPNSLVRIDMSEFSEGYNVSKLIGAPAGYIGYKDGGKLSEAIKHKPYSVVLLDEIEKAHPDIFNLLLQILDEGHLTDAVGKKIDFKNTIIIMTSNIGVDSFNQQAEMGFDLDVKKTDHKSEELKNHIKEDMKEYFRPEFLNRIDKTVIFNALNSKDLQKIVKLRIIELNERLVDKNIKLNLEPQASKWLAQKDFDADFGARTINRNISEIENLLAEGILHDEFTDNDNIKITIKEDALKLSK